MEINKFFQSKTFHVSLIIIGAFVILLLVFEAGTFAGYHKSKFSCRWDENYMRNFTGPHKGAMKEFGKEFSGKQFLNAHGVAGSVVKLDGDTFVLKGIDGAEKIVLLTEKTVINRFKETISPAELEVDDNLVIIGSPNDAGQIEAKLIRIMPPTPPIKPPAAPATTPEAMIK